MITAPAKTSASLFALALLFLAAPLPVSAAPLDAKDVASDPSALAHIDFDALKNSSIGKSFFADEDVQKKLSMTQLLFNFDIRTQLHGLTVYTRAGAPREGVLIVYADFDPHRLMALAQAANGAETVTNNSHVICSWLGDKKKNSGEYKRIYGAAAGSRLLFGDDENVVAHALDVIAGSAPGFAGHEGFARPADGESILAQALVLKFPFDSHGNAAIFKMSKDARLKISEISTNLDARLRLDAADNDTATQIAAVAQGLLAMLKLEQNKPAVLKLANAIDIQQNGTSVSVSLSVPSSEVIGQLKAGHGQRMERQAERAEKLDH